MPTFYFAREVKVKGGKKIRLYRFTCWEKTNGKNEDSPDFKVVRDEKGEILNFKDFYTVYVFCTDREVPRRVVNLDGFRIIQ